jgi:hypothetical protein
MADTTAARRIEARREEAIKLGAEIGDLCVGLDDSWRWDHWATGAARAARLSTAADELAAVFNDLQSFKEVGHDTGK